MKSATLRPLIVIASLAIGCAACSTVPIATGCSELARTTLTRPTAHAEIGDTGDPATDWQLYGVAETGQLNKANDRAQTGFDIVNACEVRDAQIRAHLERPWWRRLVPGSRSGAGRGPAAEIPTPHAPRGVEAPAGSPAGAFFRSGGGDLAGGWFAGRCFALSTRGGLVLTLALSPGRRGRIPG
jgi:hypothetical protein